MTLGEFREYTKLLPDDIKIKFSYSEESITVNTFTTSGTDLVLCGKVYMMDDKVQIYKTILQISANYENLKKRKSSE